MGLSVSQIYANARAAGFSASEAITATAIAMAESGGNPAAHNPNPPDNSYGLWQINMIGGLGPARLREFGLSSYSQLLDPMTNARAARRVFLDAGGHFTPWTTYTHGSYQRFLGQAQAAAGGAPIPPTTGGAGGGTSGVPVSSGTASPFPTWGPSWLPWNWFSDAGNAAASEVQSGISQALDGVRFIVIEGAVVVLGLGLIGVGLYKIASPKIHAAAEQVSDSLPPVIPIPV